jgi:SnoaL-like domain
MREPGADRNDLALRRLLDEREIRDVLMRYCRGIDRMDRALVRSCYHHGATDSHGSFDGTVDEFLTWVWRVLGRYTSTMHFLGNVLVEHVAADAARVETYGIAFHRTDGGDERSNLVTGFRYVDDFTRRDVDGAPAWRIARRTAVTEWVRVARAEDTWPIPEGTITGRRDRRDPVYRDHVAGSGG